MITIISYILLTFINILLIVELLYKIVYFGISIRCLKGTRREYWYTNIGLRGRDTIVWFTCKRYEKMLFLEIY